MAKKDKTDQVENQKQVTQDSEVEQLKIRVQELEEAYARARADYANFENRVKHQQAQFVKLTSATLLSKFMFILDNLEMAATHLKDPGLDMVVTEINKMIAEEGVTEVDAQGQAFNPESMECQELVDGDKDMVQKVVRKGYWLDKHLIRPAKVTVGNGEQSSEEEK